MIDLLKPRYIAIADYPGYTFEIGKILDDEIIIESMIKYPHLFRKLEWWEERNIEDMPIYLKFDEDRNTISYINKDEEPEIHKVKRHWATSIDTHWRYGDKECFISEWHNKQYSYNSFVPATKEEYDDFCKLTNEDLNVTTVD